MDRQTERADELALPLRALTVPPENWSSVPSTHVRWLTTAHHRPSGSDNHFWPLWVSIHMHVHIHTLSKIEKMIWEVTAENLGNEVKQNRQAQCSWVLERAVYVCCSYVCIINTEARGWHQLSVSAVLYLSDFETDFLIESELAGQRMPEMSLCGPSHPILTHKEDCRFMPLCVSLHRY